MAAGQYLGIIGGIVGAIIGGVITRTPAGAMWGFTIGSTLGGLAGAAFFTEKPNPRSVAPPQPRENRIQVSSYGAMIPEVNGVKRFAGNILLAPPTVETVRRSKHRQEGVRYYENELIYTRTLVILFCKGPCAGIGRMWVDNEVFVDFRDPSGTYYPPNAGEQARANLDTSNKLAGQFFTFYYGTEDQMPDPTYQAAVGAGLTPAFRGWCYAVFPDFPIGKFGTLPNIEAEIIKTGNTVTAAAYVEPSVIFGEDTWPSLQSHMWTADGNLVVCRNTTTREFVILKGFTNTVLARFFIPPVLYYNAGSIGGWGVNPRTGRFYVTVNHSVGQVAFVRRNLIYDRPNGQLEYSQDNSYDLGSAPYAWQCLRILFDANDRLWMVYATYANGWQYYQGLMRCDDNMDADGLGGYQQHRFYKSDGGYFDQWGDWGSDGEYFYFLGADPATGTGSYLIRINPALLQVSGTYPSASRVIIPYGAWEVLRVASTADFPWGWSNGLGFPAGVYLTPTEYDGGLKIKMHANVASPTVYSRAYAGESEAPLDEVFTGFCTRAGLSTLEVDAAALASDKVLGYGITRQMPARTAIEPLMLPYQFDVGEIDWKLTAVKRGGASVATIPDSDLGVVPDGAEPIDRVVEVREQDIELPTHLSLTYESKARDYDLATQNAVRVDRPNFVPMNISSPLVMTDTMAKRAAEVALAVYHLSRRRFKFTTGPKYIKCAPTDVVTVAGKDMRIVSVAWRNGVVEFEAEAEEGGSYTNAAQAQDIGYALPDLTAHSYLPALLLFHIPAIHEDHGNAGIYATLYGLAASFRGGTLQRSVDGGAGFTDVGVFGPTSAVVGLCVTTLTAGIEGCLDYSASVTVDLSAVGLPLASATDGELANGANLAAIGATAAGYEIVQFKTATLASGQYVLTGLLRGLYGTAARMAGHVASENFILLNDLTGIEFVSLNASDIGVKYLYRAVNPAGLAGSTVAYTSPGLALLPYPVQGVYAGRLTDGACRLFWRRGDRFEFTRPDLPDFLDEPLSEVPESYQVDVIHPLTQAVLRTLPSASPTVTYTAAQQAADQYPKRVLYDTCDGAFDALWTPRIYSGTVGYDSGRMKFDGVGVNAELKPTFARSGKLLLRWRYYKHSYNTMTEDSHGPNVCGVFIVRTTPAYNNAWSAQGHPEQDVGNNSWLSCCPLTYLDGSTNRFNSAKVHTRVTGTQAQVAVASSTVLDWYAAGAYSDWSWEIDFVNHTVSLNINGVQLVTNAAFSSSLDAQLGANVCVVIHSNVYSVSDRVQRFDDIQAYAVATHPNPITFDIYQLSPVLGRGSVRRVEL